MISPKAREELKFWKGLLVSWTLPSFLTVVWLKIHTKQCFSTSWNPHPHLKNKTFTSPFKPAPIISFQNLKNDQTLKTQNRGNQFVTFVIVQWWSRVWFFATPITGFPVLHSLLGFAQIHVHFVDILTISSSGMDPTRHSQLATGSTYHRQFAAYSVGQLLAGQLNNSS